MVDHLRVLNNKSPIKFRNQHLKKKSSKQNVHSSNQPKEAGSVYINQAIMPVINVGKHSKVVSKRNS